MCDLLDNAFAKAGRIPDLVLSGHVHNYQRFQRKVANRQTLTYIVAGAGGYPNLHSMAKVEGELPPTPWTDPVSGYTLANYSKEHRHGFLRLSITKTQIRGVYTTVPRPQESWTDGPVTPIDHFQIRTKRP